MLIHQGIYIRNTFTVCKGLSVDIASAPLLHASAPLLHARKLVSLLPPTCVPVYRPPLVLTMGRMRSIVTVPGASKACLSKSRKTPHNSNYKVGKNSVTGRKSAGLRLVVSGHSFIRQWKWVTLNTVTPPVVQGDRCDRNVPNQPIQVYMDATHEQSEMLANSLEVVTVYKRVFTVVA